MKNESQLNLTWETFFFFTYTLVLLSFSRVQDHYFSLKLWLFIFNFVFQFGERFGPNLAPEISCLRADRGWGLPPSVSILNGYVIAGLLLVGPCCVEMRAWMPQSWPLDPTSHFVFFTLSLSFFCLSPSLTSHLLSLPVCLSLCQWNMHADRTDTFLSVVNNVLPSGEVDTRRARPGLLMHRSVGA